MIGTLYGEKYAYGPFFLTIAVAGNLFVLVGSLSSGSLLTGLGETRMLMKQSLITMAFGVPLGLILIPTLGITGLIIASTVAGVPSLVWVLYWIWKQYNARADFQSSAKIFLVSALAAVMTYLPVYLLDIANWMRLVLGLTIFLTLYIFSAPFIGAVSQADIINLRAMFSGMNIVSRIIDLPLKAAERAAQARSGNRKSYEKT
jgi:O-antigen/teichoic acid export membrane protein